MVESVQGVLGRYSGTRVAKHRRSLEKIKTRLETLEANYTPQVVNDGVVVLKRGSKANPEAAQAYHQLRQQLP